jgi:hypothetical protein
MTFFDKIKQKINKKTMSDIGQDMSSEAVYHSYFNWMVQEEASNESAKREAMLWRKFANPKLGWTQRTLKFLDAPYLQKLGSPLPTDLNKVIVSFLYASANSSSYKFWVR